MPSTTVCQVQAGRRPDAVSICLHPPIWSPRFRQPSVCPEPWQRAHRPTGEKARFPCRTSQAAWGLGGQPSGLVNSTAWASWSKIRRETAGKQEEMKLAGPLGEGNGFLGRGQRNTWGREPTWPVRDMGRLQQRQQRPAGRDHIPKDLGIKPSCQRC